MTETLIDIENSSISPTTNEQDANIFSKFKKWLIDWTILPEQQKLSFNSTPYFMTLITFIRFVICAVGYIVFYVVLKQNDPRFALLLSLYTTSCLGAHILIGIPLEITYGTLKMSAFYILSLVYPHIVGEIILTEYDFFQMDPCTLALIGLHLSNIIKNWTSFSNKFQRIIVLLAFGFTLELYILTASLEFNRWQVIIYRLTCGIAGFLYGILTGYFWVYRNKEEDKPETTWRSFSIVLTCLVVYLIVVEFSGVHLTYAEYNEAYHKTRIIL